MEATHDWAINILLCLAPIVRIYVDLKCLFILNWFGNRRMVHEAEYRRKLQAWLALKVQHVHKCQMCLRGPRAGWKVPVQGPHPTRVSFFLSACRQLFNSFLYNCYQAPLCSIGFLSVAVAEEPPLSPARRLSRASLLDYLTFSVLLCLWNRLDCSFSCLQSRNDFKTVSWRHDKTIIHQQFFAAFKGPKDYIPGPGEYNPLTADELSKHKRYGFLQQTSRFGPDGIGLWYKNLRARLYSISRIYSRTSSEPSGEFYASTEHSLPSLSSETRLSLSSSSTTKTEDARTRRQMSDMASQFEKYRVAMQKEIDALQLKSRKMESNLQAALSQKESIQSNLLNKEQELAEMRMKNNTLQKTVSGQLRTLT